MNSLSWAGNGLHYLMKNIAEPVTTIKSKSHKRSSSNEPIRGRFDSQLTIWPHVSILSKRVHVSLDHHLLHSPAIRCAHVDFKCESATACLGLTPTSFG